MSRDRRDRDPNRISLLVRNLPLEARPDDVKAKFEQFGEIRDVYMPKDYYTHRPRGFGFIEFRDPRDAEEALYRLDRTNFMGREISVVMSRESRKTPRDMIQRERTTGSSKDDRGYDRGSSRDYRDRDRYRDRSRSPRRRSRSPRGGGGGRDSRRGRSYSRSRSPPRRESYRRHSRSRSRSRSPPRRRESPPARRYDEEVPARSPGPADRRDDDYVEPRGRSRSRSPGSYDRDANGHHSPASYENGASPRDRSPGYDREVPAAADSPRSGGRGGGGYLDDDDDEVLDHGQ